MPKARRLNETAAVDTLQPNGGSAGAPAAGMDDVVSRSQLMAQAINAITGMDKQQLKDFLTASLAQIGQEAQNIPDGAAQQNAGSIAAKPSEAVREEIDEIFGEDLSEEFRDRVSTMFEATVKSHLAVEVAALEEEFEQRLVTEAAEMRDELAEQVGKYLDYTVAEWLKENALAIETGLKAEITESFMSGLQELFTSHYMSVPEEQTDIVEELTARVEQLTEQLNEDRAELIEKNKIIEEAIRTAMIHEATENLSAFQAARVQTLAENVEFVDEDDYARRLDIILESVVTRTTPRRSTGLIVEEADGVDPNYVERHPEPANQYVAALNRTAPRKS